MKHRSLIFTYFVAIGITIIKGKFLVAKVTFAFRKYCLFKTNQNHNMQLWSFYTWSMICIFNGTVMIMYLLSNVKFIQKHGILTAL